MEKEDIFLQRSEVVDDCLNRKSPDIFFHIAEAPYASLSHSTQEKLVVSTDPSWI